MTKLTDRLYGRDVVESGIAALNSVKECDKANGHCLHGQYSMYHASSSDRYQSKGYVYWCCMCSARADTRKVVDYLGLEVR